MTDYITDIAASIEADAGKGDWTESQWRDWYLEEITAEVRYDLTAKQLFKVLGITKGQAVVSAIRASLPDVADELKIHGLDISHEDFGTLAASLVEGNVLDEADVAKIRSLKMATGPRYELRQLPFPRERYFGKAPA